MSTIYEVAKLKKTVVDIEVHTSIQTALEIMKTNSITKIPVYGQAGHFITSSDPKKSTFNDKQYIAIINILDLLNNLDKKSVFECIGSCLESQSLWVIDGSEPIKSVMELMSKSVHSILVSNVDLYFVTQTDILRYITKTDGKVKDIMSKSIKQIENCKIKGLIRYMVENSVQSIVCDNKIFTSKDILENLDMLNFLEQDTCNIITRSAVIVHPNDSILTTCSKCLENGVNQAWVYDEGMIAGEKVNNLLGICTMTDMIKFYYSQ
ncbi:hypothetical protein HDV01_003934 [Terramyces sp. JEL0728]|nr:hypothetical protein HDV01_003934 [Terramyces sp. JEL0728]